MFLVWQSNIKFRYSRCYYITSHQNIHEPRTTFFSGGQFLFCLSVLGSTISSVENVGVGKLLPPSFCIFPVLEPEILHES